MATTPKYTRENERIVSKQSFQEVTADNYRLAFMFERDDKGLTTDIQVQITDDKGQYAGSYNLNRDNVGSTSNFQFDPDEKDATIKQIRAEAKAIKAEFPRTA